MSNRWLDTGTGHRRESAQAPTIPREEGVMANAGLFLGWGDPVRGREQPGLKVLGEGLEYYARLEQEGRIEGFETVFLEPHGGDLSGFILLRGSEEQMDAVQRDD